MEWGVLDPDRHGPLVQDLDRVMRRAGLNPSRKNLIFHSTPDCVTMDELTFMQKIKVLAEKDVAGWVYTSQNTDVLTRIEAVTACLIRNFVDARIMTLRDLIEHMRNGDPVEARVLLCPNFFVQSSAVPTWQVGLLDDLLKERALHGEPTVLYVEDIDECRRKYGGQIQELLTTRYRQVGND